MMVTNYLNALKLTPPQQPNLAFLQTLTQRHIERFTFNNLAVLLHENIQLDSESVFQKVVQRDVGGYCFEHNKLAYDALAQSGYNVRLVLAKVINNNERPVPRTHRLTIVEVEGQSFLVDVGFGAACPILPIALHASTPQNAGFEQYQIQSVNNNEYELVLLKEGGPFVLYRFDFAQYNEADCEMGHFYSHKHPLAVFVNNLVVSKKTPTNTFAISNQHFIHSSTSGEKRSLITTSRDLFDLLSNVFGLSIEQEVCDFLFTQHIATRLETF